MNRFFVWFDSISVLPGTYSLSWVAWFYTKRYVDLTVLESYSSLVHWWFKFQSRLGIRVDDWMEWVDGRLWIDWGKVWWSDSTLFTYWCVGLSFVLVWDRWSRSWFWVGRERSASRVYLRYCFTLCTNRSISRSFPYRMHWVMLTCIISIGRLVQTHLTW